MKESVKKNRRSSTRSSDRSSSPPARRNASMAKGTSIPMISGKGSQQRAKKHGAGKRANGTLVKPERVREGMSGLDAAAKVLAEAAKPLNAIDIVKGMLGKGLWKTGGKIPQATIYAAIIREINKKGDASRFRKAGRGHFTVTSHAKGVR